MDTMNDLLICEECGKPFKKRQEAKHSWYTHTMKCRLGGGWSYPEVRMGIKEGFIKAVVAMEDTHE